MSSRLSQSPSLEVFLDKEIIFQSYGKWLYPLFDLEDFLETHPVDLSHALVIDKVVGKAAALLIVRLGFVRVHGEIMSKLAVQVFESFKTRFSFINQVSRIDCKTEELLSNIHDLETAYNLLCARADRK